MKIDCPQILSALEILKKSGNEIIQVSKGWSDVRIDIRMKFKLPGNLKNKICEKEPDLQYWSYKGSPHNEPDEGFLCRQHGISISFPVS